MSIPDCESPMSQEQQDLFDFMLFHTWPQAMAEYGIKSRSILRTVLIRTALGLPWHRGHVGGPHPYLNFEKEAKLVHLIEEASESHQCLSTGDVASLAFALKTESIIEACASLRQRRCPKLADSIQGEVLPPSPSWLCRFAQRNQLHNVLAREMEASRHFGCERSVIVQYFLKFLPAFNRDPRLIFGADETDMRPAARFRVLCPQEAEGFTTAEDENMSHISAMCCHNAAGVAVPPFIILSKLQALPPELRSPDISSPNIAWFGSTERGYMTEGAFYLWAVLFVTWLSGYRATCLPEELKLANILLIIDGCTSHHCPEALDLFRRHNVTVLILPAHTSHLLQAFDVTIASTLKAYFRRFVGEEKKQASVQQLTKAAKTRLTLVRSFLRAWHASASPAMCCKSFEVVGVFPPCPTRVLASPFVTSDACPSRRENQVNNSIVTDIGFIQELRGSLKRDVMKELPDPWSLRDYDDVIAWLRRQAPKQGKLLSEPPALYVLRQGEWVVSRTWASQPQQPVHPAVLMRTMHMLTLDMTGAGQGILDDYVNQQTQERHEIERAVIEEAARHMAHEMATSLALERLRSFSRLTGQELEAELLQRLQVTLEASGIDPDVRDVLAHGASCCVASAIEKLLDACSSDIA